jgi:WhiB family redox-sensing transcriptional regulator
MSEIFRFINVPCQETTDVNVFFPDAMDREAINKAKEYCDRCSKTAECLSYAISTNTQYGVFGGLTEAERHYIKRRNERMRSKEKKNREANQTESGINS